MQASLLPLFSKSRYLHIRPGDTPESHKEIREAERFLSAATGFFIRHDRKFAEGFLDLILAFPTGSLEDLSVVVEPRNEADLLLYCPEKFVLVIEFKIDARLYGHQNYTQDQFKYGDWLAKEYAHPATHLFYVILDQNGSLESGLIGKYGQRIEVKNISWKDIRSLEWSNRKLREDYFNLCSALGVRSNLCGADYAAYSEACKGENW